jgi:hypothetical protein
MSAGFSPLPAPNLRMTRDHGQTPALQALQGHMTSVRRPVCGFRES